MGNPHGWPHGGGCRAPNVPTGRAAAPISHSCAAGGAPRPLSFGHRCVAEQGLVYLVSEVPEVGGGLERTEMELEAEGTHHPLAQQLDVTKQGDGTHEIEWDAPEKVAALDVHVAALEGSGGYHLGVEIVGSIQVRAHAAVSTCCPRRLVCARVSACCSAASPRVLALSLIHI